MPVGEDQRQHLELTRDLAQRFNHRYGKTFGVPEPYILKATAKITDLQDPTAKMSKSRPRRAGIIELLDDPRPSRKKIRVGGHRHRQRDRRRRGEQARHHQPAPIYSALTGRADPRAGASSTPGRGYGDLKKDLAEVVVETFTPFRERTEKLLADEAELDGMLAAGAERARAVARETMEKVRDRVGFLPAMPIGSAGTGPRAGHPHGRAPSAGATHRAPAGTRAGRLQDARTPERDNRPWGTDRPPDRRGRGT